jgi:hypothetical protein
MANDKATTATAKKTTDAAPEGVMLAPEGFIPLNLDRAFYSPQHTAVPLQGYLIQHETMHSPSLDRDFDAVIIRTTADTVCVDGAKNPVPVKAGSDVILVITSSLKKLLQLTGKDLIPEVCIQHAGKRPIGGGKTLNTYNSWMTPAETWKTRQDVAPDTLGSGESFEFGQMGAGNGAGSKQLSA